MATLEELEKQVNDLKTIVYQILKSLEEHPRESTRIIIKPDYKTNIDSLKTAIEKI